MQQTCPLCLGNKFAAPCALCKGLGTIPGIYKQPKKRFSLPDKKSMFRLARPFTVWCWAIIVLSLTLFFY